MLENSQKAAVVELREGEMSGGEAGGDWGRQEDHTGCGQDGGSRRRGQWVPQTSIMQDIPGLKRDPRRTGMMLSAVLEDTQSPSQPLEPLHT